MTADTFWITGDPDADRLLAADPFALLVGMLLDQQVTMETAFLGPYKIAQRMDGIDAGRIAKTGVDDFIALATTPPAIHRYGRSMAARVHALAETVVAQYDGDASRIWTDPDDSGDPPSGVVVLSRLRALPGFGVQKARIFLAVLGKRCGVCPPGWRDAAGAYGVPGSRRSVADATDPARLAEVREYKKALKASARAADTSPPGDENVAESAP